MSEKADDSTLCLTFVITWVDGLVGVLEVAYRHLIFFVLGMSMDA